MTVMSDAWIRAQGSAIISPFSPKQVRTRDQLVHGLGISAPNPCLSYGTSSYGYDLRCSRQFRIFTPTWGTLIDPKRFDDRAFVAHEGDSCIIPPNSFILTSSVERLRIPRHCLGIVIGKSTYARCGIVCGCTPLEPEWEGHVTIELSNTTPLPAIVYADEGVVQLLFLDGGGCETSYADRDNGAGGKYQRQDMDPTPPKT